MNILFINNFLWDFWFLRYRECPYLGTVRIRVISVFGYFPLLSVSQGIRFFN